MYRWVHRFTPELIDAARPARHHVGDRWSVDETNVKVARVWRYVYRAVDQRGQVIVPVPATRYRPARRFFATALTAHGEPTQVFTDRAAALANVNEDLIPAAVHSTGQYETTGSNVTMAGSRPDCDRCGLRTDRTASV